MIKMLTNFVSALISNSVKIYVIFLYRVSGIYVNKEKDLSGIER